MVNDDGTDRFLQNAKLYEPHPSQVLKMDNRYYKLRNGTPNRKEIKVNGHRDDCSCYFCITQ